ncbi:endonuclease/exonuclease/phosphatase family protein [Epilithonimonas sp. JDS]|uniref:endonuclease/exonuclease/phosphatase family protein n=1 Tax=Epilithonimonas sp. JDS TaxID=2902797 RepID=UPI001E4B0640|nr:endonuclease/exonuclease/phosphatase family protein [Epilithonimonas sp. JDS]MCD9854998.1 endonuclease/exonuclease/phosphatase family protein [Epilithonimonas sp. JDS]
MNSELMMFYNVENLFPPDDKYGEIKSSGFRNWDEYKYHLKIRKISNVFRFLEQDFGQLPSIIGLAEIGARSVLEDLVNENSPIQPYEIIYKQSQDSRGLSVALLFDKDKYTLIRFDALKFQMDEDVEFDTRDILHAELLFEDKKIHVFVCHLPSKREKDIKKAQRNYILEKLHETIRDLAGKGEPIILMGDFNENPDAAELQKFLFDHSGNKMLSNPFEALYLNNQFSTYHGKKGVGFDQILYTENLLLEQLHFTAITAEIYNAPQLRNKELKNNHYPQRTYSGSRYMGGWSDHFPVVVKLRKHDNS